MIRKRLNKSDVVVDKKEQTIREYGVGAQILAAQGVEKMRLITNTMPRLVGLEAYKLELVGITPIVSK